jgi:hypothetical protein
MKQDKKADPLVERRLTNTKLLTWAAFLGGFVSYVYVLRGWRAGCSDGALMSTGPLLIIAAAIVVNGWKSGYENGKKIDGHVKRRFAESLISAAASALTSGNPASALSVFLSALSSSEPPNEPEEINADQVEAPAPDQIPPNESDAAPQNESTQTAG